MKKIALLDLPPRLYVSKAKPLSEMAEKVDQSNRCQEIQHLLVPRVMKLDDVRVKVSHDGRVPPQEAVERILKNRKVIKSGQWEVLSNERGTPCA